MRSWSERFLSDSPLRFFYFSDFDIRDKKNVGRREMDTIESKKNLNKLSIIKIRYESKFKNAGGLSLNSMACHLKNFNKKKYQFRITKENIK